MTKATTALTRAARPVELLLSLVFLAGAILKAADVNLFVVQISYYGVVDGHAQLAASALATLWLETALSIALLLACRIRGLTFAAILALLAAFTALIAYGWAYHGLQDCGCFGPIEISPTVSILKNLGLATAALIAWLGLAKAHRLDAPAAATFAKIVISALAATAVAAYAYANLEDMGDQERPFAELVFEDAGVTYDLGNGEHFVVLLNTTCHHCQGSVETLNEFALIPDFPTVVALCFEDDELPLDDFRLLTSPLFPTFSMAGRTRLFWSLVDTPPRFALVRNGAQIHYWDDEPPEPDDVVALRAR